MNFNFDETAGNSQNTIKPTLEGNAIYEVTFDGCESRDVDGKQDPTKKFKILDIKFSNDQGKFVHTEFEPTDADCVDGQTPFGGPKPSRVKTMMLLFKHLIDAVNPELGKAIDCKEKSLNTTSWDALRQLMVQATESGKGTKTKIKLVKTNKGDASFPFFANYSKEGKLYMSTNFIGNNIFFTSKELDKISKASTAQPTTTANLDTFDKVAQTTAPSDFNFSF